jgi:hypothetical protein
MAALIGFEFQGKSDPRHDIGPYPSLRHFPEKNLPSTQPVERLHLKKTSIPQEKPIKRGLKMLEAKNSISPHQKHQERVHLRPRDSEPPALEPVMERKNRDFSHFAMTLPRYSSLKNGEQQTRGRVPNLIDRRNGIDVKVLGDKQYHSVEFSPNFFVYSKQNKGGGGIALPSKLSKEEKNARRDKAAADARARRYGLAMPGEATQEPVHSSYCYILIVIIYIFNNSCYYSHYLTKSLSMNKMSKQRQLPKSRVCVVCMPFREIELLSSCLLSVCVHASPTLAGAWARHRCLRADVHTHTPDPCVSTQRARNTFLDAAAREAAARTRIGCFSSVWGSVSRLSGQT